MEGTVPTPNGNISVYYNAKQIKGKADEGTDTLRFTSKTKPKSKGVKIQAMGNTK